MIRLDLTPAELDLLLTGIDRLITERAMRQAPNADRHAADGLLEQLEDRLRIAARQVGGGA